MDRPRPVESDDPGALLAARVVNTKKKPSTVWTDVCLVFEDAFEIDHLAKGPAVGAPTERPIGARKDDAPVGQFVRDPHRRLARFGAASLLAGSRSTLGWVAAARACPDHRDE
jgi:hypothetical protein